MKLSKMAQSALRSKYPVLVLGGPGSGKTTLSLLKAKTHVSELLDGQAILFLSFSRAAIRQVEIRYHDLLNEQEQQSIEVRTYHSFALDVIKAHGKLLTGKYPRIISPGKEALLKSRSSGCWANEVRRLASEEGRYSFNEFAVAANKIILGSTAVAELIADTYPMIILDEFQDTTDSQWELVKTLSQRSRMMFLADLDQRIFDYDVHVSPDRLQQLKEYLHPFEFNLGSDNHRSPNSGILSYANAILHGTSLPTVPEVKIKTYYSKEIGTTVHAAALCMLSTLQDDGIEKPSVALLARTNSMVAKVSDYLAQEHNHKGNSLIPVIHDVLWDATLTVAASLAVASIMEWPTLPKDVALIRTFELIIEYFEIKSSLRKGGIKYAQKISKNLSEEIANLRNGNSLKCKLAKYFEEIYVTDVAKCSFSGDPEHDWLRARNLLDKEVDHLHVVYNDVKFVRLFRSSDQIGECLSSIWDKQGSYFGASSMLRRLLEMQSLQADYKEAHGCSLMTVHKSKGKEFDGVIIVDGHPKSPNAFFRFNAPSSEHEDARRLLRVAITRARRRVLILRPNYTILKH